MTGPLYKEEHAVTEFKTYAEPAGFPGGEPGAVTTDLYKLEKTEVTKHGHIKCLLFTVVVHATNSFDGHPVARIQVTSRYFVEYNPTEQVKLDQACELVEKSILNASALYREKVAGTYLADTTLQVPQHIREDYISKKTEAGNKNAC